MKHIVFIFFVVILGGLLSYEVSAQKGLKYSSVRRVHVEQPDKKIEAYVSLDKKVSPAPELVYYWYDNNLIHHTQGGYSYYLLDGVYTEYYYPNNNLCSRGRFKKGLKQGKWHSWSPDGKLNEGVRWRNGTIDGKRSVYSDDGSLQRVEKYRNGMLDGKTLYLDSSNNTVVAVYKEGILKSEKTQKKGEVSFTLLDKIKMLFDKKEKRKGAKDPNIQKE